LAIFPDELDTSDENDLNQFNEKFVYLYGHFMAVLSSTDATCTNGTTVPSTFAFEKQILYSQILTPCRGHREVCTVREFAEQVMLPTGMPFTADPRVTSKMGSKYQDNCIILTPSLKSDAEDFYYICSQRIDILNEVKW